VGFQCTVHSGAGHLWRNSPESVFTRVIRCRWQGQTGWSLDMRASSPVVVFPFLHKGKPRTEKYTLRGQRDCAVAQGAINRKLLEDTRADKQYVLIFTKNGRYSTVVASS